MTSHITRIVSRLHACNARDGWRAREPLRTATPVIQAARHREAKDATPSRVAVAMPLLLALAACHGGPADRPGIPAQRSPAATPAPVAASGIHGTATYVERIRMPPGAALHIDLSDAASGTVLARGTVQDVGSPPIAFALPRPAADASLALSATLVGPGGERWFETPAPVAVPPADVAVELRMRRVADGDAAPPQRNGDVAHWECGDLGVMSRFDNAAGRVRLSFNGRAVTLPLARSASGARYADARGNEFWTKGTTGTLRLAGEPSRDCVLAAQPSPWNAALLRGVAFRAVGSEPGWSAEMSGDPPTLDALLDYGGRHLTAPLRPAPGGYQRRDAGEAVVLRIDRIPCRDGMSGQAFEASVALQVGGTTYHGCGADLRD